MSLVCENDLYQTRKSLRVLLHVHPNNMTEEHMGSLKAALAAVNLVWEDVKKEWGVGKCPSCGKDTWLRDSEEPKHYGCVSCHWDDYDDDYVEEDE